MTTLPHDLQIALQYAYTPAGLLIQGLAAEQENQAYNAHTFTIDRHHIKFRSAKITPIKIGQFVAFYTRKNGLCVPYDEADDFDFLIVSTRAGAQLGHFIFPKSLLLEKGILAKKGKAGKRALRVYPPWDKPTSKSAHATQQWQLPYFVTILPLCVSVHARLAALLASTDMLRKSHEHPQASAE
jgi:hypothetical protein